MDKIQQLKNKYYQYVKDKGYDQFYYVPLDATFPLSKKDWNNQIDQIWLTNTAVDFLKKNPDKLYEWSIDELERTFNYLFDTGQLTPISKQFEIVKPPMGRLYTWDFLSDDYPVSHSKLYIPYTDKTGKIKDFTINRKSTSENYNYFTANCADATGYCLQDANDDFKHPDTFHTPASVREAALKVPGAIDRGRYVAIPIQNLQDIVDSGSKYYESITDDIYKNKSIRKEGGMINRQINNNMKLLSKKKIGGIIKLQDGNELPPGTHGAQDNPIRLPEYIQNDFTNWYQPFDPRVYVEKKGSKTSKEEINNAAMWKKAQPIYQQLINSGINPYIAVGILGNIAQESGCDPNASNGTHFGYTQNETRARNWIHKSYGGYGHEHQLSFLIDGLKGRIKGDLKSPWGIEFTKRFNGFIKSVKGVKDIPTIVRNWEKHYERSGGQANSGRVKYATYFAKQLGLI